MFRKSNRLFNTPRRSIGYMDLTERHGGMQKYNPLKQPSLFTELEPTESLFDEEGEFVSSLSKESDALFAALTGQA
jgi:hypothetical protein